MQLMKRISLTVIFVIFSLVAYEERRCAVDIGSGWIKMHMALVDTENNQIIKVLNEPFLSYIALANYYAQDGEINREVQRKVLDAFDKILTLCNQYGIQKMAGVATEIFRKAGDSGLHLFHAIENMAKKQLGIENVSLHIVSQEIEGQLGFLTATALSSEYDCNDIVSWDSGNASFQLVMKDDSKYITYEERLGSAIAAQLFVEKIRKQPYQRTAPISPIKSEEIEKFIELIFDVIDPSEAFVKKMRSKNCNIIGIGGSSSIFSLASKSIGKNIFSLDKLQKIVYSYASLEQSAYQITHLDPHEPETVMTRLMFLYAIMKRLSIDTIEYKASAGNTLGIFLYKDFWNHVNS